MSRVGRRTGALRPAPPAGHGTLRRRRAAPPRYVGRGEKLAGRLRSRIGGDRPYGGNGRRISPDTAIGHINAAAQFFRWLDRSDYWTPCRHYEEAFAFDRRSLERHSNGKTKQGIDVADVDMQGSVGASVLVDQLPYDSVWVELDHDDVHPGLWMWSKQRAYALQDEPFWHIDGDTYLLKRLKVEYESTSVVAQNFETAGSMRPVQGTFRTQPSH